MKQEKYFCDLCKNEMKDIIAFIDYVKIGEYSERIDICNTCYKDLIRFLKEKTEGKKKE